MPTIILIPIAPLLLWITYIMLASPKSHVGGMIYYVYLMIIADVVVIFGIVTSILRVFYFRKVFKNRYPEKMLIDDDFIILKYLDGSSRKIYYSDFTWKLRFELIFKNTKYYPCLYALLDDGIKFIRNCWKDIENKEKIIEILIKKVGMHRSMIDILMGIPPGWVKLIISPEVMGGIENVIKMLEDWKEKYEAYLKRIGRYEEEKKKAEEWKRRIEETERKEQEAKKRRESPEGARRHFYWLTAVVIFAVVTFIFLSLLPFLNSPTESNFILFSVDGIITFWLLVAGVQKLPKLYQKGWKWRRRGEEKP